MLIWRAEHMQCQWLWRAQITWNSSMVALVICNISRQNKSHAKTPEHHTPMHIKHMHTDYTHTHTHMHISHTHILTFTTITTDYIHAQIYRQEPEGRNNWEYGSVGCGDIGTISPAEWPIRSIGGTFPWACKTHERREKWGTLWSNRISILDTWPQHSPHLHLVIPRSLWPKRGEIQKYILSPVVYVWVTSE